MTIKRRQSLVRKDGIIKFKDVDTKSEKAKVFLDGSFCDVFWERGEGMRKFHAFTLKSGVSFCGHWFMGGASAANDLDVLPLKDQESNKCKACQKQLNKKKFVSKGTLTYEDIKEAIKKFGGEPIIPNLIFETLMMEIHPLTDDLNFMSPLEFPEPEGLWHYRFRTFPQKIANVLSKIRWKIFPYYVISKEEWESVN